MATEPVFTRYLYEYLQVKYNLLEALLDGEGDEALFWAYELYYSGFQENVWEWLHKIYYKRYQATNPRFERWLNQFYEEWKNPPANESDETTKRDCLLGSVVYSLAIQDWQEVVSQKYVVIYREDMPASYNVEDVDEEIIPRPLQTEAPKAPAYRYLEKVCHYSVREETIKATEDLYTTSIKDAYLGSNWLYYCRKCPIWEERIRVGKGIIDDATKTVAFESDDDLEAFYRLWGFEPDEQCKEMHACHGIHLVENCT